MMKQVLHHCCKVLTILQKKLWLMALGCTLMHCSFAQVLTEKPISLDIKKQPLGDVLEIISNQADFYFSYNSNIINKDSLVSITVSGKPLRLVLDQLFRNRYAYRVSGKYIIVRLAAYNPPPQKSAYNNGYILRGYIVDRETGEAVRDASVYEKKHLQSALTNANGYFAIRLK
ncbi:MAG TPA: STN and carboxypeptidase regulatory-like domain-containing protein, partial [Chitinophagaceae bacterium]|nr:STN and carboxypeptidase regulatory-like domain-containing protein [Chitinophagaceae bacterium]